MISRILRIRRSSVGSSRRNERILSPTKRRSAAIDVVIQITVATMVVPGFVEQGCSGGTDGEPNKTRGTPGQVPEVWVAGVGVEHGERLGIWRLHGQVEVVLICVQYAE
jgi:hypothetical protein